MSIPYTDNASVSFCC